MSIFGGRVLNTLMGAAHNALILTRSICAAAITPVLIYVVVRYVRRWRQVLEAEVDGTRWDGFVAALGPRAARWCRWTFTLWILMLLGLSIALTGNT